MKPVAWIDKKVFTQKWTTMALVSTVEQFDDAIPLYTAPRELSDDEIWELHQEYIDEVPCGHSMKTVGFIEFARAILKKASEQ